MFFVPIALLIMSFSSCATAIHGKDQVVNIVSEPQGAVVLVDGSPVGETPLAVSLPRKHDHQITVSKQGYHEEETKVARKLSPVVLLYLLPGGAISFGADAIHGAQFSFPDNVKITLEPLFSPKVVLTRQLNVMKSIARKLLLRKEQVLAFNQL
jgi:hypothetical protein